MKQQEKDSKRSFFNRQTNLGFELVAMVLIGALGGYGVDRKLGTSPWLLLVGFILGSAAGILNILQSIPPEDIEKKRKGY